MSKTYFVKGGLCACTIKIIKKNPVDIVIVSGILYENVVNESAYYIASAPTGHINSFSGSGLPFPNEEIAFLHTPNKGELNLSFNKFKVKLLMPNSYCVNMCNKLIEPSLLIKYNNGEKIRMLRIPVGNRMPYRSQNYPYTRTDPNFYNPGWNMPIRSQEEIIIESQYPKVNMMPDNHWGLKPSI
tara:strand:+ start:793 stop:1347 length:555 start_codon:yes stop_codon:yes gene_type:complete